MEEYQRRVIQEHKELSDKLEKLRQFMRSDTFAGLSFSDKNLLVKQEIAMREYRDVLELRRKNFSGDHDEYRIGE